MGGPCQEARWGACRSWRRLKQFADNFHTVIARRDRAMRGHRTPGEATPLKHRWLRGYWIARSSRAMTVMGLDNRQAQCAVGGRSPADQRAAALFHRTPR